MLLSLLCPPPRFGSSVLAPTAALFLFILLQLVVVECYKYR